MPLNGCTGASDFTDKVLIIPTEVGTFPAVEDDETF